MPGRPQWRKGSSTENVHETQKAKKISLEQQSRGYCCRRPRQHAANQRCDGRTFTMLAGIRADGAPHIAFPEALRASSGLIQVELIRPLTVAGAAQVRKADE
jgi:hypothetical protein